MTTWDTGTGNAGVLRLTMSENSWDVGSNTSSVYIKAEIYTPSGSYNNYNNLSVSLSGDVSWNTQTWGFSGSGWKTLYEANVTRGHNADGTGSITVSFSLDEYSATSGVGGPTTNGPRTLGLSTIPRASTATFSPQSSFDAGSAVTINTNWASSSFTHNINYYFGSASGTVATGVGGSVSWTPPLSLLTQIPNATSGNGYIDVATYNGGTYIGSKTTTFTLRAGYSAVPSISSLTLTDTDTAVVNAVGAYLQTLTDLKCVVNAAGYQGSTITSSTFTVNGITTASGGTITLPSSGTIAVSAITTDSRGRTATYSQNISVLPYSLPAFTSYQVRRCTVAGVLDDNGTYLRVDLIAASRSIINGTEKNTLTINTFSRQRGTTPWTARNVIAHTSVSYNNNYIVSGGAAFPINTSFEVKVEIIDKFNTSGAQTTVPTATVLMNLSRTGVGVGKYHELGVLDANGDIYQSGYKVVDQSMIATQDEIGVGTNNTKYVTPLELNDRVEIVPALLEPGYRIGGPARVTFLPGSTLSTEYYEWIGKYEAWGNRTVNMVRRGSTWAILGHCNDKYYGGKVSLPLGLGWMSYNTFNNTDEYVEPMRGQRLSSGIVVLSGMAFFQGRLGVANEIICTLPVGLRPDTDLWVVARISDVDVMVEIRAATGAVAIFDYYYDTGTNPWVSLDGLAFPAAGVATWTKITAFQNGWTNYGGSLGEAAYWKDPYGIVWFRGAVGGGTMTSDLAMFHLPAGMGNNKQSHILTASSNPMNSKGFGFVSTFPDSASGKVAYKTGNKGNGWISLARVTNVTDTAMSTLSWRTLQLHNSWAPYAGFTVPAVCLRPDGLAMAQGLLSPGTAGANIFNVGPELRPSKNMILSTVGADTSRRFDMLGPSRAYSNGWHGEVRSSGTVSAWQSLDGLKWMVGD